MMAMIGKKILDERNVTQAEARAIIEERELAEELLYEQKVALDIIRYFTHLPPEQAREMVERLGEEVPRIKEESIVKIVDLMPSDKEDLNVIFSKERVILTDDEVAKILEVVDNYR